MNGIMKKLSIIIPTYNGAQCIKYTIESVLIQIRNYLDDVEFIIRDNCSTDETSDIIMEYINNYPNIIKYFRREMTVRSNDNFREAVELSNGEYLLMLGDDDILFPTFIGMTLELINNNPKVGLIYYNRITTTRSFHGALLKHKDPVPSFIKTYNNAGDFIKHYISGPDFMSVNVIRRECYNNGLSFSKLDYYGYEWYSILLKGIENHYCISVFAPMVLQTVPQVREWSDKMVLYIIIGLGNMFRDLDKFYPGVFQSWIEYNRNNNSRLKLLLSMRLNKQFYKTKWNELCTHLSTVEKIIAKLILI